MSGTVIKVALTLMASLFFGIGVIAAINPLWLVRLLNYFYGQPRRDVWWTINRWRDPSEVGSSRDMKIQCRMMGIGFIIFGAIFLHTLI
jgi:hypothetical protein